MIPYIIHASLYDAWHGVASYSGDDALVVATTVVKVYVLDADGYMHVL